MISEETAGRSGSHQCLHYTKSEVKSRKVFLTFFFEASISVMIQERAIPDRINATLLSQISESFFDGFLWNINFRDFSRNSSSGLRIASMSQEVSSFVYLAATILIVKRQDKVPKT